MIDLSIIIVNYNVKEFILTLLNSIQKAVTNLNTEIIVVDNASDDGSVELIREKFPKVKVIANKVNVGFGNANNQALEIAKGKYFLLINPDTIVKENTFEKLIKFFENNSNAGIAGCKVLNPDGTLQLACRRSFPGPWTSFTKVMGLSRIFPNSKLFAKYNLTYLDENKTYEVDSVSGAFMMMKKEVYDSIGGFDKDFFMYGEDLDLCYRAQKAGFKVFYVHDTEIIHYKGESTKRSSLDETKVFYAAMHLFVKKHFSTSFLVESILQMAIFLRKFIAFINVYKLPITAIIIDFIVFSFAIFLAEKIYNPDYWTGFPEYVKPWIYIVPAFIQIIISALSGAYRKKSLSVLLSFLSLIYGLIFLSALTFFFKQFAFSRAVILIMYLILFILVPFWKIIFKMFFKVGIQESSKKTRTLIVGTNEKAIRLASKLKSSFMHLHNIVGFISLSRKLIGEKIDQYKFLGSLENIRKVIAEEKIDKVIFSSDEISFDQMFYVVSVCQGENVEFLVAGGELDFLVGKSSITMLDDIPLLTVNYNISSFVHKFTKRVFDFVLSLPILFLIYPFIIIFKNKRNSKSDFMKFISALPSVFIGKKSFVGPFLNSYNSDLYLGKLGITGLWYTESYDKSDSKEINKLDLFYAKNQSVWLDLEILGKTFAKMFLKSE